MKKIILILIALTAITAGCVKYEEGACISNLSVKKRIYGFHTLTEYYVNDVDSLSQYYDSLGLSFDFIYDEDAYIDACLMDGRRKDGAGTYLLWNWNLSDHNKYLNCTATGGTIIGIGPFGKNKMPVWEILKLGKEQIKLKTLYNTKEYKIVLNR